MGAGDFGGNVEAEPEASGRATATRWKGWLPELAIERLRERMGCPALNRTSEE
jgi:hypothetical protein